MGAAAQPNPLSTIISLLFGGLDLSSVNDLTALALVGLTDDKWQTHCRFWLPSEGLGEKSLIGFNLVVRILT